MEKRRNWVHKFQSQENRSVIAYSTEKSEFKIWRHYQSALWYLLQGRVSGVFSEGFYRVRSRKVIPIHDNHVNWGLGKHKFRFAKLKESLRIFQPIHFTLHKLFLYNMGISIDGALVGLYCSLPRFFSTGRQQLIIQTKSPLLCSSFCLLVDIFYLFLILLWL
jgi:hypothetical protein